MFRRARSRLNRLTYATILRRTRSDLATFLPTEAVMLSIGLPYDAPPLFVHPDTRVAAEPILALPEFPFDWTPPRPRTAVRKIRIPRRFNPPPSSSAPPPLAAVITPPSVTEPCLSPHSASLRALHIYDDVKHLLDTLGIFWAVTATRPTYPLLVYEFLSSLNYDADTVTITYSLGGTQWTVTSAELAAMFYIPPGTAINPPGFHKGTFWRLLTGRTWAADKAKANDIYHPVLRQTHRAIFSSLLSHGDSTTTVREIDLHILYAVIYPSATTAPNRLNLARFLMEHWFLLATNKLTCPIGIGGHVTTLAEHHNINSSSMRGPPIEPLLFNFPNMKKMQLVALLPGNREWGHRSTLHAPAGLTEVIPFSLLPNFSLLDHTTWLHPNLLPQPQPDPPAKQPTPPAAPATLAGQRGSSSRHRPTRARKHPTSPAAVSSSAATGDQQPPPPPTPHHAAPAAPSDPTMPLILAELRSIRDGQQRLHAVLDRILAALTRRAAP